MHVMDLGVSQYLVGMVFRRLIENNVAGSTHEHIEVRRFHNIKYLRRRLTKFYGAGVKARGTMSAIGRLTLKMLGSLSTPMLHSKAAECRN